MKDRIRVCVAGATGWVGQSLVSAIVEDEGLELVAAVGLTSAGRSLSEVLGPDVPILEISASVEEALSKADVDVLVDYTKPEVVRGNVLAAIGAGVHSVVGTSGLTEEDFEEIGNRAEAAGVGVLARGNFAIGAVLLQEFARVAAAKFPTWEIIDRSSATKRDAPSGTARELASSLARIRQPETPVAVEDTVGPIETRGANLGGTQVHSIRVPGYVVSTEIVFGGDDQRLVISHDAGATAAPYVGGTLAAIRDVIGQKGLVRGAEGGRA